MDTIEEERPNAAVYTAASSSGLAQHVNHLAQFHIKDITRPLTLSEQELLANRLVKQIVQEERAKQVQLTLPKHLDDIRRMVDPAGKVQGKLPIFSQLSPRTRRKLAVLPKPNEFELQQIHDLERQAKLLGGKVAYQQIHDPKQFVELEKEILQKEITDVNPHLIPNVIDPRNVSKVTTKYFEDSERYKRRKAEQVKQLDRLFGDHPYSSKNNGGHDNHHHDQGSIQGHSVSTLSSSSRHRSPSPPSSSSAKLTSSGLQGEEENKDNSKKDAISFADIAAVAMIHSSVIPSPRSQPQQAANNNNKAGNTSSNTNGKNRKKNGKLSTNSAKYLPPLLSSTTGDAHQPHNQLSPSNMFSSKTLSSANFFGGSGNTMASNNGYSALRPVTSSSSMTSNGAVVYSDLKSQESRQASSSVLQERDYLNEFSAKVKDEMGIDLNAKYNRIRKFRQLLQVLLLHVLHCKQRSAIQRWWEVTLMLRKRQHQSAATRIYLALKSGIFWRKKREQAHYEALQQADELRRAKENANFISKQAVIITKTIRRYVKRKHIWYLQQIRRAATSIQRVFRGRKGRKRFKKLWLANSRIHFAAIRIQCMVRMRLAYRKMVLTRKLSFVEHWIDGLTAKTQRYRHVFLQGGAASYISRRYRHHLIMRRLHRIVYWNHVAKAIVLQRVYRGHRIRKVFRQRLSLYRAHQQRQELAAVIIQKYIRRWLAEHAADHLYSQREEQKQDRYQEKLWMMAQGISWQQKLRIMYRNLKLKTKINKMLYLHRQVTQIQRIWRGHHGRVRMWYVRVHARIAYWTNVYRLRHKACIRIQRVYRGYLARKRHRQRILLKNVLLVQCAFRAFVARSRTRQLKYVHVQAKKLTQMIRRIIHQHRFHIKFMRQQLLAQKIVIIQKKVRCCLAIMRVKDKRAQHRREMELLASARSHILHLLTGIQCRLLQDTLQKPIQQRSYVVSRQDCLCLGPIQAIFVMGFCHGNRLRTEAKYLATHKVDSASFVKFLMKIEGLVQMTRLQMQAMGFGGGNSKYQRPANGVYHQHEHSDTEHHMFRQRTFLSAQALQQPLLTLLVTGDIPLPAMKTTLSTTDIDLAFKKAKSEENVTHKLGYLEFVQALDIIAQIHYQERDKKYMKNDKSNTDNDENKTEEQEQEGEARDEAVEEAPPSRPQSPSSPSAKDNNAGSAENAENEEDNNNPVGTVGEVGQNLQELLSEQIRQVHHGHNTAFLTRENLTLDPYSILSSDSSHSPKSATSKQQSSVDYRFALVIRLLYVFQQESYVQEVLNWLSKESLARLGLFVIRIQCLVRKRLAYLRIRRVQLEHLEAKKQAAIAGQLAHIQAMVRSFIHRRRVMKLAQRLIIKYHPYLADPYYYNPRTMVKTYQKPKILGYLDAFTVALPEEGLAYDVYCYNCSSQRASCFCQECEDSMCRLCFDSLHCKGQRRSHRAQSIPTCAYCHGQQMATKSCVTCVIAPPQPNSYRGTIHPVHKRAYYCDTCFVHEHDAHFYRQLEQVPTKRQAYQTLMNHSKQATLVASTLNQRIRTRHVYTNLVQVCEECQQFASAWRCFDCEQVYCGRCLVVFHQLNPKFVTHAIEQLPYYTPDMHKSYHADVARKRFTYKWERLLLQERRRAQEIAFHAAVKIQSWYRMHFYRRIGKKHMQRRRSKQRSMYRLRQKENQLFRNQQWYQIQDYFGRAPMLISDTREEKVLKRMWLTSRESARRYIIQNYDEWGFYRLRNRYVHNTDFDAGTSPHGKHHNKKHNAKKHSHVPILHVHAKRKGEPKRGFDVGEIDELIEQANYGGYRLPGKVIVRENDQYAETTYNLMPYLRRGEIVRIHHRYFGVIVVEEKRVKLSRKWYMPNSKKNEEDEEGQQQRMVDEVDAEIEAMAEKLKRAAQRKEKKVKRKKDQSEKDQNREEDETAEEKKRRLAKDKEEDGAGSIVSLDKLHAEEWSFVMYRVPTYRDEQGQLYYKAKYVAYEWTVNNPIYQASLLASRMYAQRMIRLSLHFYHANQQSRNPQEAQEWKQSAMKYMQEVRQKTAKLATGDAFVDLSSLASPYLRGQEEDPVVNPVLKPIYLEDQEAWVALQSPDHRRRKSKLNSGGDDDEDDDDESGSEDSEGLSNSDEDDDESRDPLSPKIRRKPDSGDLSGVSGNKILVGDGDGSPLAESKSRRPRVRNTAVSSTTAAAAAANNNKMDELNEEEEEEEERLREEQRQKKAAAKKKEKGENDSDDDSDEENKDNEDDDDMADAHIDYDSAYIDPETGQKTLSAAELKRKEREERAKAKKEAKKNKKGNSKKKDKKFTKPKKAWFATKEQEEERKLREDKMTIVELAMEAVEWKEEIDVMTENIYFININTNEMMTTIPRAVAAKRQMEFENSRKKRDYDIAQQRIRRLEMETRNRLLITGGRKK